MQTTDARDEAERIEREERAEKKRLNESFETEARMREERAKAEELAATLQLIRKVEKCRRGTCKHATKRECQLLINQLDNGSL